MTLTMLLWLQEEALKLCLDPLKPLLGSIALDDGESSSCGGFLYVLGFGDCGMKFVEHRPLFIGLLVPSHRGCEDQAFLSTNRIETRLRSKDIAKGVILGFVYDMEIGLPIGLAGLGEILIRGRVRLGQLG
jgi:hypothetical protein